MKSKLVLVDSNILVYAVNSSSPKHQAAQSFLQTYIGQLVLAHQNIFESLRVLTHRKFEYPMTATGAGKAIGSIAELCRIIEPNRNTYYLALGLAQKYSLYGDEIFDAYLAATALSNDVTVIATDNTKHFTRFDALEIYNPFG